MGILGDEVASTIDNTMQDHAEQAGLDLPKGRGSVSQPAVEVAPVEAQEEASTAA
jgi:hypothetical protein